MARPNPPAASCLKALPSREVQEFLSAVQEGRLEQAPEAFRRLRSHAQLPRKSREGFGGLRALLHYFLESCASSKQVFEALSLLDELKASSEALEAVF